MTRKTAVDPSSYWEDADALYRAAARARTWMAAPEGGVGDAPARARSLRALLAAVLPTDRAERGRLARALEIAPDFVDALADQGRNPVALPPAVLAVVARGLRIETDAFSALLREELGPSTGGPGILRAGGRPDGVERAFRDAMARELDDAPRDDDALRED